MASKGGKKGAAPRRRRAQQDRRIERLRHYIRSEGPRFLEDPNITSLGIGHKITGGKRTDKLCIQFTVASKRGEGVGLEELGTELIPETLDVDGEAIPTDVLERRFALAFQLATAEETDPRKQRLDPMVPGISVSHPSGTAGTLGVIVFDRQAGDACMLSNWHVLHRATGNIGDAVVQPGPFDDNNLQLNRAGTLLRSHLGPAGDCAIARLEERHFDRTVLGLGVQPRQVGRVDLGDRVVKSGRTTGVTRGVVRRIDVMVAMSYAGVGPQQIGGFEIGPEEGAPASLEISMGGDSGSAWLIAAEDGSPSDVLAGLHFAGESSDNPDEHALACYAHSVFKKLDISLEPVVIADLEPGLGFDTGFLASPVPLPELAPAQLADAFELNGSPFVPYTHFSVCLSKERGLPRFVAWNIDGGRVRRLSRDGIPFVLDERIPEEFQHGNELYRDNPLDRGHVARRADLTWGSQVEAERANRESFTYTNITPQHRSFNQSSLGGLWGRLENAVFDEVDVADLKVSVLAGPILRADDPLHRGVGIPRDFWKLVAYTDSADDTFKVRAFVLTQQDLLSDLEALELDPFRVFQVSLETLEQMTGLDLAPLAAADTFQSAIEAEELAARPARAREVRTVEGLFV